MCQHSCHRLPQSSWHTSANHSSSSSHSRASGQSRCPQWLVWQPRSLTGVLLVAAQLPEAVQRLGPVKALAAAGSAVGALLLIETGW